jgi:CopG family nickel-responsive transcriptional regulator
MSNISVSLTEANLESLDKLGSELGLSGRSETLRAAIRSLDDEVKDRRELSGTVEGALVIVVGPDHAASLQAMRHVHRGIVTAQVHSHLSDGSCVEAMMVRGPSGDVRGLVDSIRSEAGFRSVRFLPF